MLSYSESEIRSKAVDLGLIKDGDPLPNRHRGRVVAALVEEQRAQAPRPAADEPRIAAEIVIQPTGPILIDGVAFPWIVTTEPMDIRLAADGSGTVRLTLAAQAIQIIKPELTKEEQS